MHGTGIKIKFKKITEGCSVSECSVVRVKRTKGKLEILTFMLLFTKIISSGLYSKCRSHTCNVLLAYISIIQQ
jgi:hypothetical protein